MVGRNAVVSRGDLFSENRGDVHRAMGKIGERFDASWHEEWGRVEVSIVPAVRGDRCKVERGTVAEEHVIDALEWKNEDVIS